MHRVLPVPGHLPRDPRPRGEQAGLRRPALLHAHRRARHAPARHRSSASDSAQEEHGLGYCNITKCCTEVCPEGIHITDNAIIPMKERVVDTKYDPAFGLFRVLRARSKSKSAMNEQAERAWGLLRSVEDGDVEYAAVADQVADAMQQAKAVASTGTVLARLEALDHFEAGRLDQAAEEARASLNWHRSAQERSDAWVTLARVYDAQERATATVEAVENARRFWPDNPRLRHFAGEGHQP